MYHYLHLNLPKSTSKEPHLYLDNIARADYIDLLKEFFFNEHKKEDSVFKSFLIDVIVADELLVFHYEEETFISEFEAPEREWKSVINTFQDSLASTLKIEQLEFISNIDLHFSYKPYQEKAIKAFILKLLGIFSERYKQIEQFSTHRKYLPLFKQHFRVLINKVQKDYAAFLPKKVDPIIEILSTEELNTLQIEPPSLHISVFDEIKDLKDERGRIIFKIENQDAAKSDFKNLLYNQPDKIKSPITVTASFVYITAARYLISRISHYVGIPDNVLPEYRAFLLNGKPLTANSTYTAKLRMQNKKLAVKEMLDNILYKHIF
jgi:hypothetical protein